jgi:phage-related minor tail protein
MNKHMMIDMETLLQQLDEVQARLDLLELELTASCHEHAQLCKSHQEQEHQIQILEDEKQQAIQELISCQERLTLLEAQQAKWDATPDMLAENLILMHENEQLKEENDTLQTNGYALDENQVLTEENQQLANRNQELETHIHALEAENSQLHEENALLKSATHRQEPAPAKEDDAQPEKPSPSKKPTASRKSKKAQETPDTPQLFLDFD